MLGDIARRHAEQDQRAGTSVSRCDFRHHALRALCQHFARAGFAPVAAVGWDGERLGANDLTPDPACQPEAVAANAAKAGLIVIWGPEPGPRDGDDTRGVGAGSNVVHSTPPSCPPSFVA